MTGAAVLTPRVVANRLGVTEANVLEMQDDGLLPLRLTLDGIEAHIERRLRWMEKREREREQQCRDGALPSQGPD